jgi:hypothetical protein
MKPSKTLGRGMPPRSDASKLTLLKFTPTNIIDFPNISPRLEVVEECNREFRLVQAEREQERIDNQSTLANALQVRAQRRAFKRYVATTISLAACIALAVLAL